MLAAPRSGADQAALDRAISVLAEHFADSGATRLDLPHIYQADGLLDLYGEDLRARAFVYPDPDQGRELCLRPDFTVPVALAHADQGWDQVASYTYQGPVFRRQPPGLQRPVEYMQAGIERFGDTDRIAAEVGVFKSLYRGLSELDLDEPEVTIGDLSIPFAILNALDMPEHRRASLRRHFWRPNRFRDLLERAQTPSKARKVPGDELDQRVNEAGEIVGLRSITDVTKRLIRLAGARNDAPVRPEQAQLIDRVLQIRAPARSALIELEKISGTAGVDLSAIIETLAKRLEALDVAGIGMDRVVFDASFGRNLEYYDGFVFELRAPGDPHGHPPLAGGGRYDAMTTRLGSPAPVPAVGGIIRPEAVLEALA
ncbi:MAG: ATP phosphoribosyltransferase regulatory subunit [Pseudomonadota bacterium]